MQIPLDSRFSALDKDDSIALLIQQNEIPMAQSVRPPWAEKKIEELEGQLVKNSCNSSKPPSSDSYDKFALKGRRKKNGRSSGGPSGHKARTLKQMEHPDIVQDHEVFCCTHCYTNLSNQAATAHEARQVFDLSEIRVAVTEHRVQIKACPHRDTCIKAKFSAGVTQSIQYGNGIHVAATCLSQCQRLPYFSRLQELFHGLFRIKLSQGTLNNILSQCYQQLERFDGAAIIPFEEKI